MLPGTTSEERTGRGYSQVKPWLWLLGPALIRFALIPFSHNWDIQTWYNLFADFKQGHSPYDTLQTLIYESRAAHSALYYQYFTYPPGLLYLYWPVAQLYFLFNPNQTLPPHFSGEATWAVVPVPFSFNYFFNLPIILADLGIALLLKKMGGLQSARRYAWSPYAILISIWMFDALMVLCLLWGVYALQKQRRNQAAVAFALGTVLKFVPLFVVPAIALYLLRRGVSFFGLLRFGLVYLLGCVALVAGPVPLVGANFWEGSWLSLEFNQAREGGNLSWHTVFNFYKIWNQGAIPSHTMTYLSAAIGAVTLPLGLLVTYFYTYRKNLSLNQTVLVALLGYLLSTKLINETYLLALLPFLLLELEQHPAPLKEWLYQLLWSIPFSWALYNAVFPYFFFTPLAQLGLLNSTAAIGLQSAIDIRFVSLVNALLGLSYTLLCLFAIPVFSGWEKGQRLALAPPS